MDSCASLAEELEPTNPFVVEFEELTVDIDRELNDWVLEALGKLLDTVLRVRDSLLERFEIALIVSGVNVVEQLASGTYES